MLKILWIMGEIAPKEQFLPLSTILCYQEQFLPLSTIFCYLMLDFYVKTGIRVSLRDKRLFEIIQVEIARVDCTFAYKSLDAIVRSQLIARSQLIRTN